MMRRLLVNDQLTALPGHKTFWHDLQEWLGCEFVGGDYATLAKTADSAVDDMSLACGYPFVNLIIRNASYFGPLMSSKRVPTISLLQDIFTDGPQREMQEAVIRSSRAVVYNSAFTLDKCSAYYGDSGILAFAHVIPLPVDFDTFRPGNPMGLQQALGLPDGTVCWVGASQGAAGQVKGFDVFLKVVRLNPDIPFVAVFKDAIPESMPPNMRCYVKLPQDELSRVIVACRVGLCTSRTESQHLAGIEMGACGLPVVAPTVGVYWQRKDLPGTLVMTPPDGSSVEYYTAAVRTTLKEPGDPQAIRAYWEKEFSRPIIKAAWTALVEEIESAVVDSHKRDS